ncbi:unnamed protein product [Microthlaspi erraticum]|uniref:MADS-box domain-containing protein n=1 Tax=Microthlaspi erraticum TaxID=1685480 RepID=A0A6D2J4A6_9BRAS|nr:unnamed protein product [Microthlaspi erraticum]
MGRRKVEIKRIENKSSLQVTFSKRRNGLIEKARQLSVLCDSSVAVLVVSASGKLYDSSSGDSMTKIIDRHKKIAPVPIHRRLSRCSSNHHHQRLS